MFQCALVCCPQHCARPPRVRSTRIFLSSRAAYLLCLSCHERRAVCRQANAREGNARVAVCEEGR